MSWGISENASEKEKLKAEVNDYLHGLNSVGKIDYKAYSELYDVCMPIPRFLPCVLFPFGHNTLRE